MTLEYRIRPLLRAGLELDLECRWDTDFPRRVEFSLGFWLCDPVVESRLQAMLELWLKASCKLCLILDVLVENDLLQAL